MAVRVPNRLGTKTTTTLGAATKTTTKAGT